jgi:hypothetical protein
MRKILVLILLGCFSVVMMPTSAFAKTGKHPHHHHHHKHKHHKTL